MKKLKIPLENLTAKQIFLDCVAKCHDKDALKRCADIVQEDSDNYRAAAPLGLANFNYHSQFPAGVTKTRLKEVYDNLFVPRKYFYDEILYQDEVCLCPVCDISEPSTLDHYLPKSVVPTVAVTPHNLVPMCARCNTVKSDKMETDVRRLPFHLYFDDFPNEPWLTVRFVAGAELAAHYVVRCPDDWDLVLKARLRRHMELYDLETRFSINACREMTGKRKKWKRLLSARGVDALREEIQEEKISQEELDVNSWKAALYRGLEEHMDMLTNWLNADARTSLAEVG